MRPAPLLVVVLAACCLSSALFAQEDRRRRRVAIPVEEFLPPAAELFLSLPDGRMVAEILARTGEDRKALAARLAKGAGLEAGPVATLLEILTASADGPVTFSIHPQQVRGRRAPPAFLVTAATRRRTQALEDAGRKLVQTLLAPAFAKRVRGNRIMGLPVLQLSGRGRDLYSTYTRGYLLFSDSGLLLGRVIREMQSPSGQTLRHSADYRRSRTVAKVGEGDGFLMVADPALLPVPAVLGAVDGAGVLARDGEGFRDEVLLTLGERGVARHLRSGKVPAGWMAAGGERGGWIGASLTPTGVLGFVLSMISLGSRQVVLGIGDVAEGPVEALLRADGPPLLRIRLKEGVDASRALKPLGGMARRTGRTLFVCEDAAALADLPEATEAVWEGPGEAAVLLSLPVLSGVIGRPGGPEGKRVAWSLVSAAGRLRVATKGDAVGPIQALVASLFR